MWMLPPEEKNTNGRRLPLYKRIMAHIEQGIEQGLLGEGERLPSERQLCLFLGVNRSTVIRALNGLADRGVLRRKTGSGTFVSHEKWGLQHYPILNWQPAPVGRARHSHDHYAAHAARMREQARQGGAACMDLASNDLPHDLLPSGALPEFSWQELILQELGSDTSPMGLRSFRQTVQAFLRDSWQLDVPYEDILITSGTQQALFLITQCLLSPGDAIGIETPSYFYSLPVFQAAGLRLYPIAADSEGITLEALDALHDRRQLRMVFLNPIFQNPTGRVMSTRRKKALVRYCALKHIPIVEDDAYSLLGFSDAVDISPLKRYDHDGQLLYLGSLSMYMGKNIRAGWMLAPASIAARLAEVRQQMDAGLSVLPQLMAGHYLRMTARRHRAGLRAALAERARQLVCWLENGWPGLFRYTQPEGGCYLYARCEQMAEKDYDALVQQLLHQRIIVGRGSECGDGSFALRLNFGHFRPPEADMRE